MWLACLPVVPAYIPPSGGNIFKYMPHSVLPHFEPRVDSFHSLHSDVPITGHIYTLGKCAMKSYIGEVEFWESLVNTISEFKYKLILIKSEVHKGPVTFNFAQVITEYMVKWNLVTKYNVMKVTEYFVSSLTSVFQIGNVSTSCLAYLNSHDDPACWQFCQWTA